MQQVQQFSFLRRLRSLESPVLGSPASELAIWVFAASGSAVLEQATSS